MLDCRAFSQPNRGDRLEEREQRTAEESRLLSGDDRDAPWIAQSGCRGQCIGRRAAGSVGSPAKNSARRG
jgi:hypothetical protein